MGIISDPLDEVLSSRAKVRLLRLYSTDPEPMSAREAARRVGMAKRSVDLGLRDLVSVGVILRTGLGPQPMYVLNSHSALVRHALLPLFRGCRPADEPGDGERGAIAELFATLQEAVEVPDGACVEWAVLFGSTANRTDTSRSDIDFGVIVTDEPDLERMRTRLAEMLPTVRRRFGRLLSPVVMTLDQARGLATAGHPLLDAIAAGRVILARHPTLREVLHRKD